MMLSIGVEVNLEAKVMVEADHPVACAVASTVENPTTGETVLLLAKSAKCVKKIIFSIQSAKAIPMRNEIPVTIDIGQGKAKGKIP